MIYLKLFESFDKSKIDEICEKYGIKNYDINTDGSIDVDGNVNNEIGLYDFNLTELPLKFNKVNCSIDFSTNKLKSFKGSPIEVNGGVFCYNNRLTSFEFAPKIIRGDFDCRWNNIVSFEHFPKFVKNDFYCGCNPIWEIWKLFEDTTKIELLNDFDIFRDEDTDTPGIVMDRLNDFLLTIGVNTVEKVEGYKII